MRSIVPRIRANLVVTITARFTEINWISRPSGRYNYQLRIELLLDTGHWAGVFNRSRLAGACVHHKYVLLERWLCNRDGVNVIGHAIILFYKCTTAGERLIMYAQKLMLTRPNVIHFINKYFVTLKKKKITNFFIKSVDL